MQSSATISHNPSEINFFFRFSRVLLNGGLWWLGRERHGAAEDLEVVLGCPNFLPPAICRAELKVRDLS